MKTKILNFGIIKIIYIFITFLLLLGLFFVKLDGLNIREISMIFSLIATIQLIFGCIVWYKKTNDLNHPFIYFVLVCYVCWFGQMIFRSLGLTSINEVVIDGFNPNEFFVTGKYAVLGFSCMFLGGILLLKNTKKQFISQVFIKDRKLYRVVTLVAGLMVVGGFFFHYIDLFTALKASLENGYNTIFDNNYVGIFRSIYNIFSNFSMFFWPGMFLLLVSNRNSKKVFLFFILCVLTDVLVLFAIGTRSEALALLLTSFWLYTTLYKKINLKLILIVGILGVILLRVLGVIYVFRISEIRTFGYFIELFFTLKSSQVFEILREFGFNIFSLHHTIKLVPIDYAYGYGYTYFAAIMAIIPSLLMGGFSFSDAAALPQWLMKALDMNYGPGYSILAESYYNFGNLGFLAMIVIGMVLFRLFDNNKKSDMRIIYQGFIAIALFSNLFIARDTMLFVFRKYFYIILIPLIIIKLIYKYYNNKKVLKILHIFNPIISWLERDNYNYITNKIIIITNSNYSLPIKKIRDKLSNVKISITYLNIDDYNYLKKLFLLLKIILTKKYDTIICCYNDIFYKYLKNSLFDDRYKVVLIRKNINLKKDKMLIDNKFNLHLTVSSNSNYDKFVRELLEEREYYYEKNE